jgi:iron complex transport system ATP-binding protein
VSDGPLLAISDLHFAYGDQSVLRGVTVSLSAGEVVALLGPNGSGKSTLLRVALGQLAPAGGAVRWEGRDVAHWPRRELARRVAYLPQAPTAELDHRVADVLRLGRAPYWGAFGLESPRDARVVAEVADTLQLADLLDRPMDQLSGGQRQRVFLGRCLAQEPAALLLDEPTTFLDLRHQVDLLQLLRRLAKERSVAILMASHDLNLTAALSDRAVLLDDGTVAAEGTPSDVLRPDVLSRVYGVPMRRVQQEGDRVVVVPEVIVSPNVASTGGTPVSHVARP